MTYQCEKCGHLDSPIWKPLYWRLYGAYADFVEFEREHPDLALRFKNGEEKLEDQYFDYEKHGKTRIVIHRFPKAFRMMRQRKLYEKTPSEKGFKKARK